MSMKNKDNHYVFARYSLVVLWIFTGLTSLFWGSAIGYEILAQAHIVGNLADWAVLSGAGLDIFIGLWLLSGKRRRLCYFVQIGVILIYSILLTLIAPEFWLHPFGVLTKNLPILALLGMLNQTSKIA